MNTPQRVRLFRPGAPATGAATGAPAAGHPDLDNPDQIERMVTLFYRRVLEDPLLAPVFLDVAKIDLDEHLPLIAAFWKKLLLGDEAYNRHMMAKHRAVDDKQPLTGAHHERWLALFLANLSEHFDGPCTDRARHLAARIIDNLYDQLSSRRND